MNSRFAWPLLGLVLVACAGKTPDSEPAPQALLPQPFMWHVAAPDHPGTVYLLGSVHLGDGQAPMDRTVFDAMDAADVIVMEADASNQQEVARVTQQLGLLPEGETLKDRVSPETYSEFSGRLEELGMEPASFDRLQPWLAGMGLVALRLQIQGYSPDMGVEKMVESHVTDEQEVRYMESVEDQIRLFADLPPKSQEALMMEGVRATGPEQKAVLDGISQAYAEGDLETMERLVFENMEEDPELRKTMFDERNEHFAEYIDGLLDEPKVFLVVMGSGHVVGEMGVPTLLDKMGHDVERMKAKGPAPVAPAVDETSAETAESAAGRS